MANSYVKVTYHWVLPCSPTPGSPTLILTQKYGFAYGYHC